MGRETTQHISNGCWTPHSYEVICRLQPQAVLVMAPLKATKRVVLVAFHDACIPMIRFNKCLIDITSIHVWKLVQKLQFNGVHMAFWHTCNNLEISCEL